MLFGQENSTMTIGKKAKDKERKEWVEQFFEGKGARRIR